MVSNIHVSAPRKTIKDDYVLGFCDESERDRDRQIDTDRNTEREGVRQRERETQRQRGRKRQGDRETEDTETERKKETERETERQRQIRGLKNSPGRLIPELTKEESSALGEFHLTKWDQSPVLIKNQSSSSLFHLQENAGANDE